MPKHNEKMLPYLDTKRSTIKKNAIKKAGTIDHPSFDVVNTGPYRKSRFFAASENVLAYTK